ncbi:SDR family NAD(P)-dependent oxidoreductase [Pseudoclavibacter terrae]|uniref:SDR family NAD(P)-dependent oxidoreductase n=1 Tax=Pseudoclavibacter terrae TaxID=1530195 RepID=UPI00232F82C8|nr:SDR family NAD(P)-dependent oxidoreductase [Pseudoclavibacter terrae]
MSKKLAIIVGVGPGLGFALARTFADAGHPVAILGRNEARLNEFAKNLADAPAPVRAYVADASDGNDLRAAIAAAIDELEAPEVLVYNAAVLQLSSPIDGDDAVWMQSFAVNILGAKIAAETVLPALDGTGSLLFTGGGLADTPHPSYASLAVGKAGLRNYVQSLAASLEDTNVHATSVTINGGIDGGEERFSSASLAKDYLDLHHQARADWSPELRRD